MLKKIWKSKAGFTLMELIIVIVILAILALIAIPRLLGFTTTAKISNDKEYAVVVSRAGEIYYAAHYNDDTFVAGSVNLATLVSAELVNSAADELQYGTAATFVITTDGVTTVTITGGADGNIVYTSSSGGVFTTVPDQI